MLVVVKKPHTEISINGFGKTEIINYLKERFELKILSNDEESIDVKESSFWKEKATQGALLMGFRLKHGLTQKMLADKTGFSQVVISEYENNKRKITMKAAMRLAEALGEAPSSFFV